jgi:PAS domain S-box-containing protein
MEIVHPFYSDRRKSGIPLIGDLPWGTDFCQFYQTEKDLFEILVPYFMAGLENNELCLWVTSGQSGAGDPVKDLPGFKQYIDKGQMEIIPQRLWRARRDKTHGGFVVSKLDKAISGGFDGVRLAFDVSPAKRGGKVPDFGRIDVINQHNILAISSYHRDKFDASGLMEAVKNHRFALVRNADRWEVIEGSELHVVRDALKGSEETLHSLFKNMSEGFAYHRIVLDAEKKPCDYVFQEINQAFEKLTGLKRENILGKRVTKVIPGIEKDPTDWIGEYGKVAMTGKPVQFENYSAALDRWYSVSAFSPHKGYFAVTFSDITGQKTAEQRLREREERLRNLNRTLRALSDTGKATIHAEEVSDLMDEACRIIVEDCGHPMVWIGLAEADENKTVRPVAQAGFEEGYLKTINVTWSDTERGRGPTGTAIRTGTPDVCKNILMDPRMRPWREQAAKRGYASSIALPLVAGGQTLGALTIYSREPESFSADEVELLSELADDLAYGVTVLRLRLAHRQSETALLESRTRLDLALRSSNMGTWQWDITADRRHFDDQACRLLGIDPSTFTGSRQEFFGAVHPGDRETIRRALDRTLTQEAPYILEYRVVWPDRSVHHIASRGRLMRNDKDGSIRLNGLIWDISERKEMEAELRKSHNELELRVQERTAELSATVTRLEQANQELQEFAHVTSHDLQEPLRKIQTFSDMIKTQCGPFLDRAGQEYLDRVIRSAGRMRQLLHDLLQLSKMAGRSGPFKATDLGKIAREAADLFEEDLKKSGGVVEIQDMPSIEADETQMLRLFQNLIGNAVKYRGEASPRINISAKCEGGQCEIFIEDNGIGFEQEFAERIFKPFQRLHGRNEYEGTGMGLAICRKIVERHNGNIRAESRPGKGSTFTFKLPLAHLNERQNKIDK